MKEWLYGQKDQQRYQESDWVKSQQTRKTGIREAERHQVKKKAGIIDSPKSGIRKTTRVKGTGQLKIGK